MLNPRSLLGKVDSERLISSSFPCTIGYTMVIHLARS